MTGVRPLNVWRIVDEQADELERIGHAFIRAAERLRRTRIRLRVEPSHREDPPMTDQREDAMNDTPTAELRATQFLCTDGTSKVLLTERVDGRWQVSAESGRLASNGLSTPNVWHDVPDFEAAQKRAVSVLWILSRERAAYETYRTASYEAQAALDALAADG